MTVIYQLLSGLSAADMDGLLDYFKEVWTRILPELGCEVQEGLQGCVQYRRDP